MRSKIRPGAKILRQNSLLTGGFTLISTGVGMHFGLWLGLITGGVLAVAYEWHLSKPE
jgi:hypothetical protein